MNIFKINYANHGLKRYFLSPNTYQDCVDCVNIKLSLLAPVVDGHTYKYSTLNLSQMKSKKLKGKGNE